MPNYLYAATQPDTNTFGDRDDLSPGDPGKVVTGKQLDYEFLQLQSVSAAKLNVQDPAFTGIMTGGTIDGGLF
jgi:hypothetical protein